MVERCCCLAMSPIYFITLSHSFNPLFIHPSIMSKGMMDDVNNVMTHE